MPKAYLCLIRAFNGLDRKGKPLSEALPAQPGVVPTITKKTTVLIGCIPNEVAGNLTENGRPAFSYLVLGALRMG